MNPNNNLDFQSLKLAGYFRKSTESEDRQALSIDSQIDEMQEVISDYGVPKFAKKYQESKSAKEQGKRIEFLQMESDIEKGLIDSIACWKLDRLARNMIEGGKIIDWLSKGKLKCIITYEKVWYPSDNVIVMAVEFGQGKQYVKDLSVNVKRGLRKKYAKGLPSGVSTIGFKNTPHLECGQRHWTVDEVRFPLVQKAIKEFLTGTYSGKKLALYCRDVLKLTTQQHKKIGGKLVNDSYVNKMLKNPVYAGFFFTNGIRHELDPRLPTIITEEEHNKILRMLGVKNQTRYQTHETPFAKFLTGPNGETMTIDPKFQLVCDCGKKFAYRKKDECPKCNLKIGEIQNPKFLNYNYYFNATKRYRDGKYKTVEEKKVLEKTYEEIINPLSLCPELVEWFKETIEEVEDKVVREHIELNKSRVKILEEVEKEKDNLRALLRRGIINDAEYKKDLATLENGVPDVVSEKKPWKELMNEMVNLGTDCKEVFEKGDIKAKKQVLYKSQSNLIWDEEKLYIIRPNWLNKYVEAVKYAKEELATVEPNFILENPNENKNISVLKSLNLDSRLSLSGC